MLQSFVPVRKPALRVHMPREGSGYNAHECKKALLAWAATATGVQDAVAQLEAWRESLKFVALFEKYFPRQYAALAQDRDAWVLDKRTGIAPIEHKFFELVDQQLFPIGVDWMETLLAEIRAGEDVTPYIPLISLLPRPDEWEAEAQEHDAIQLLLCFTWNNWYAPDENGWLGLTARFAERNVQLPEPFWYPWRGDGFAYGGETRVRDALMALHQSVFFELARNAGLDWLKTVMEVLFRETGNLLVDYDEEMVTEPPDWSEENIEWLASEWKYGAVMMNTFWDGIHLLTEQPTLYARIVELWNQAWRIAPRKISITRA